MIKLLAALLILSPLASVTAEAGDIADLDGEAATSKKKKKTKKDAKYDFETEVIREVERGLYVKANAGATAYILKYGGGIMRSGSALSLWVGNDFIDNERNSMAWEIGVYEGVHNGMPYWEQEARGINPSRFTQGDTRTYALLLGGEYSAYPWRRVSIGAKLGTGVLIAPLLMNRDASNFETEVLYRTWAGIGNIPAVHRSPHPVAYAGVTSEWYTKLSHFSMGLDIEAFFPITFDLGISGSLYMKYTF